MKYKFETDDPIEAGQLLSARDCLSILYELRELAYKNDTVDSKIILELVSEIDFEKLWS